MSKILVINAGSSSIKWSLFEKSTLDLIASGLAERIKVDGALTLSFNGKKVEKTPILNNHTDAVKEIIQMWSENNVISNIEEITAIGFRVVHGGNYFTESTVLNDENIGLIEECVKFAPLHNPGAIAAIKSFKELLPQASLFASFDTAFHTTIPQENHLYPINFELSEKYQIKKFGFHGISHMYITRTLEKFLQKDKVNIVNLHLGNGSSLCAIKDSQSIDTSMGFTPLAGVMMGTRSGDIDPSIHEFLAKETGKNIHEITEMLNKQSGLLGVSGISNDKRDLNEKSSEGNAKATLAINLFYKTIADYLVSYLNKVSPQVDAIVFTAGIGENDWRTRKGVMERFNLLNVKLDPALNEVSPSVIGDIYKISTPDSTIPVYVVRTNEELMIAKDVLRLSK